MTNRLSDLSSIERENIDLNIAPFELTVLVNPALIIAGVAQR